MWLFAKVDEQTVGKPQIRAVVILPYLESPAVVMSRIDVGGISDGEFAFLFGHSGGEQPLLDELPVGVGDIAVASSVVGEEE